MDKTTYEIFLGGGELNAAKWRDFLSAISRYLKFGQRWRININLKDVTIHFYLESPRPLPPSFGLSDFLIKEAPSQAACTNLRSGIMKFYHHGDDGLDIIRRLASRGQDFQQISFEFRAYRKQYTCSGYLIYERNGQKYLEHLTGANPAQILASNFAQNQNYSFKKLPKYLKNEKMLKLLKEDSRDALFEVDEFPYRQNKQFLSHNAYDFQKHSLVIGGSGSGKSKYLAAFIDQIYKTAADKYKIVVIDPHAALKNDCHQIASRCEVDFCDVNNSIDLFQNNAEDINVSVELTLSLFRSLMGSDYNTQLERVLRFASHLLLSTGRFSFLRLRRLLTDVEYCNSTIKAHESQLSETVVRFFLADFSELRTKSYGVAIAPIIAFIDEMQMVPVFNQDAQLPSLPDQIQNNFLSIYSLSRPKLGHKVVQTIAGLLLQQLFLFAQHKTVSEHLLVIIDEVAIIENPILSRFLSELRKYQTSLVLAGQYFDQFSASLQEAIFANVSNYYIFRVSKRDAELLAKSLDIKLAGSDKVEDQQSALTSLKDRECLVQVSKDGESYPACKARTLDFITAETAIPPRESSSFASVDPLPPVAKTAPQADIAIKNDDTTPTLPPNSSPHFDFSLEPGTSAEMIMRITSTSRKPIKEENVKE